MNKNQPFLLSTLTNSTIRFVGYRMLKEVSQHIRLRHCLGDCQYFTVGLIIWFLMVPPLFDSPPSDNPPALDVDIDAPRSRWTIMERFDDAQDCTKALTGLSEQLRKRLPCRRDDLLYHATIPLEEKP